MIPFEIHFSDAMLTVLFPLIAGGFGMLYRLAWKQDKQIVIIQTVLEFIRRDIKTTIQNGSPK